DRADGLAGATPFGPEIDQDRGVGLEHLGLEVGIADVQNFVAHSLLLAAPGGRPTAGVGPYALNLGARSRKSTTAPIPSAVCGRRAAHGKRACTLPRLPNDR